LSFIQRPATYYSHRCSLCVLAVESILIYFLTELAERKRQSLSAARKTASISSSIILH